MEEFTKKSSSDFYAKIHFVNRDNYVPSANNLVDFSNLINHTQEKYKIFQDNRAKRVSEIHNEFDITAKDLEKALDSGDWSSARINHKRMLDLMAINNNEGLKISFDLPKYTHIASFAEIPNYINQKEKAQKILAEYNLFFMQLREVTAKNNIVLDTTNFQFSKQEFLSKKIGFSEETFSVFMYDLFKVVDYMPNMIETNFKHEGNYVLHLEFNPQQNRLQFQLHVTINKIENDFLFSKKELKESLKGNSKLKLLFMSDKPNEVVFDFGNLRKSFRIDF
jgi:hypothetical protein